MRDWISIEFASEELKSHAMLVATAFACSGPLLSLAHHSES